MFAYFLYDNLPALLALRSYKAIMRVKVYQIDVVKVDTPEHVSIKKFQNIAADVFPTIVALKIDDKSDLVGVMSLQNLGEFSPLSLSNACAKLEAAFDLLRGIWILHQHQFYVGSLPIDKVLFTDITSKKIKIKPYLATSKQILDKQEQKDKKKAQESLKIVADMTPNNISSKIEETLNDAGKQKKVEQPQSTLAKPGEAKQQIQSDPGKQNEKVNVLPSQIDVHNWAIFTASLLFQFSKSKYLEKRKTHDKKSQFVVEISKVHKFYKSEQLMNVLVQCLDYDYLKHPKVEQIILVFRQILVSSKIDINNQTIEACKQGYWRKEKQNLLEFSIQISQDVLLTDELIKKINQHFLKNNHKHAPKTFKPLFRASRFGFNTKTFYAQCLNHSRLLWVIDTEESGIICFYLEPKLAFNENEGVSGSYIGDLEQKSFIYSPKNQESYKLEVKQKAFRAVMGKGPIIGDGDIVLGAGPNRNWCYFPKSYQHGRCKKLFEKVQFSVKNYDVYTANF